MTVVCWAWEHVEGTSRAQEVAAFGATELSLSEADCTETSKCPGPCGGLADLGLRTGKSV